MAYVSGRLFSGQVTGVTVSAVPLSTGSVNIREALIQSDPTNVGNVKVGSVLSQPIVLTPGQAITLPILSLSLIYVAASVGTVTVNWLARD